MINGIISCARYAFAPNFYKYCGPDENKELREFIYHSENIESLDVHFPAPWACSPAFGGLRTSQVAIKRTSALYHQQSSYDYRSQKKKQSGIQTKIQTNLSQFQTLYPYLQTIAEANNIESPFDPRVVQAYWTGNNLLKKVRPSNFYNHLKKKLHLSEKLPKKTTKWLYPKIDEGALPDHSFHVFNIFVRTGHRMIAHTVETMDNCRISWGKIIKIHTDMLVTSSQKLEVIDGKLKLVKHHIRHLRLINPQTSLQPGDYVSGHWGWFCDQLTPTQVQNLEKLTLWNLRLANKTI